MYCERIRSSVAKDTQATDVASTSDQERRGFHRSYNSRGFLG
jgi:hypothetical protein